MALAGLREQRIEIDRVERFDREARPKIQIGSATENGNQWILQWGKANYGNISVGVSNGSYIGIIILVDRDGNEDAYPFAIVGKGVPILIGPDAFRALASITPTEKNR